MDWIWSQYTISPDPASGMQSLYETCSTLSKHVLTPSDIVLSGGGFTLRPELAEILTDALPPLGQLLNLAMKDSGLPGIQNFCQAELKILTCTMGMDIATQNQVVWNWIHLMEKLYVARVDLKSLRYGHPIHVLGRNRPTQMRETVMALPPSLHVKLSMEFLRSLGILALSPAANLSDTVQRRDHTPSRPPADSGTLLSRVETGGLASLQTSRPVAAIHAVAPTGVSQTVHKENAARTPRSLPAIATMPAPGVACMAPGYIHPESSMDELLLAYHASSDSRWSLFSRMRRIVSKKLLNSTDIMDHCKDSSPPYFGQFGLEPHLLVSTENAVLEMQWLLTAAFYFTMDRPFCFRVDPHSVLMGMLRGASCVKELQATWKALRERMEIAQRRLAEYCAGCVAEGTPLTELDGDCADNPPVSASASVLSPSSGKLLAQGPERPGALDASAQASPFTVTQQAPAPGGTSLHLVFVYVTDGSAHTAPGRTSIPASEAPKIDQVETALGHTPAAALPAAPEDLPCVSHSTPSVPSIHETSVTAEDEGTESGGQDDGLQQRADHLHSLTQCAPASGIPSPPASCGNTRAEHSRRQGELGVSAQASAPTVIRQGPMPETASPMAPMDIADTDTCTSHAAEVKLDSLAIQSKSRPRDGSTTSAYTPANTVSRSPPVPTAAANDAPHASPPTSMLPSTHGPSIDAGESTELVGLDKVRKERADNTALPRIYELPMRNSFWTAPTTDLADVKYAPKAAMPAAVKDPPCDLLCAIMFTSVRECDHPAENEGGRDRGMEENLRERESPASATCISRGASTPQSAGTGTATGEQQPVSDFELQKIGIDLEAEIGGQADEQSERVFIGSAGHEVLLLPPLLSSPFASAQSSLGGG
ncbi:hypothetical protein B0H14DRAFT_3452771 [Mycena olivaceomarginata]|nr:hypothetical protein B0H14DRAFT_3452771 [Mycena olivaceomarginata]